MKSSGQVVKVHIAKVYIMEEKFQTEFHPFAMGNVQRYTEDGGVLVNLQKGVIKISKVRDGYQEINANRVLKLGGRFLNAFRVQHQNIRTKE